MKLKESHKGDDLETKFQYLSFTQSIETPKILMQSKPGYKIGSFANPLVEELTEKILNDYSADRPGIDLVGFQEVITKNDWIATTFKNSFRQKLWQMPNLPLLTFKKQPGCLGVNCKQVKSKEDLFQQGSIYIMHDDSITKHYAMVKGSVLIIYSLNKSLSFYDVIFLKDCIIKEEIKFSLFTLSLSVSTHFDTRILLAFKSEAKMRFWLRVLKCAGNHRKFKDFYELKEKIYSGKRSSMHLVESKLKQEGLLVKILDKKKLNMLEREMMFEEVRVLKFLNHPGIVKIVEYFNKRSKFYIVLEYVKGVELLKLAFKGMIAEETLKHIMVQLLNIIDYIHSVGVIHRDIKLENIIITEDNKIVLIDFGLSAFSFSTGILRVGCGTFAYTAPEIIMKQGYNFSADMWSIGVLLFMLVTGKPPFFDVERALMMEHILDHEPTFDENIWGMYPQELMDFNKSLLNKNLNKRPTAKEALLNPWVLNSI